MIGRVISGRYVVEAVVGTGGMAVVYRAYDKIKKQTVAIKVLRPEYESDMEFVWRFSREAEAASKVSHENIANLLDVGIDGDMRYIVMEFVDGQTLKEMIREKGRINPDLALRMTIRILAAVDHAHRNGIVHRDIKPQNILVDRQGCVKVADFGIARLKTSQTTQIDDVNGPSALGSVHYFSPEQARGEVADEKSDLYSVGIVLYEMLTGQVPFDGETSVSVALKHVSEEPKSMRMYQSGISRALDEVVMRALCKEGAKRYQSAAEFAADLRKTITHPRGGFVKYPPDPEEIERQREARRRKRQRDKRRLFQMALVTGILIILCIMLVAGWYLITVYDHVTMPNVLGQEQLYAQDALEALNLRVTVERQYSEEFEEGRVISQSFAKGERVHRDSNVVIIVSAGSQWYYMEDFTGRAGVEAYETVNSYGVRSISLEYIQDPAEVGTVIGQSPAPGWQSRDSAVVFRISGQSVAAPDLTGLTLEGAVALLQAEGLIVGTVEEAGVTDSPAGTVTGQSVPADAQVLLGTQVNLTVNRLPDPVCHPYSVFTVVVPLENLRVEVELEAPSGITAIAYSEVLARGTHQLELASREQGMHVVRTYIDGVLMDSTEIMFE